MRTFSQWVGAALVALTYSALAPAAWAQGGPGGGGGPAVPVPFGGIYSFTGALGSEPTFPVDSQAVNAGFTDMSRGPGVQPSVGAGAFAGVGWTMAANGPDSTQYFSFRVTAAPGYALILDSLVFAERRSSTGPRAWQVRTSLDGFALAIAGDTIPDSTSYRTHAIALGSSFNMVTTVEFRLYSYAAEGAAGTWRIDNVTTGGFTLATRPTVQFLTATRLVTESGGAVAVPITITNPNDSVATTVQLTLAAAPGTATLGADYTFAPLTRTVTFPAGSDSTQLINVPIVDDTLTEGAETIILTLASVSTGAAIGSPDTYTITIAANDSTVSSPQNPPLEPIAAVTTNDSVGVALRLGNLVRVRGIVSTVNTRTNGFAVGLQDVTGGITLFSLGPVASAPNLVLSPGDELEVVGSIAQFNGLTEIIPDSVLTHSAGNALPTPRVVTVLGETTESEIIRINGPLTIPDPTQWTNTGSGFNVDVTDGTTTYQLRVVRGTDVYGTPAPTLPFSLTGIGGQFDTSSPYFEGYQISPRFLTDIVTDTTGNPTGPTVQFGAAPSSVLEANDTVLVNVTLLNPDSAATTTVEVLLMTTGTATAGADFTFAPATQVLTFAPGVTTQNVAIAILDDTITEPAETVKLMLLNATGGATVSTPMEYTLTIVDNDSTINPTPPTLQFGSAVSTVVEATTTVQVPVTLTNPDSATVTVEAILMPGTATAGTDFTFAPATQVLTFPAGTTTRNVTISIIGDTQLEPNETVLLVLMNATGGATIGTPMDYTLTIVDNDSTTAPTPPLRLIASAVATDAQGVATLDGQVVRLRGIVTSPNIRTAGYSVTMQDRSGRGITVFKTTPLGTQTIAPGDSLEVVGAITQFNGLTEIIPDSFRTRFTNQQLPIPRVVTVLDETTESLLVKINGPLTIPTPSQWTNAAAGFTVDVTDGPTTYALRVPRGSALIGTPAPTTPFRLTGTGGQFDNTSPFLQGYQISPRTVADIEAVVGFADEAATAALNLYPNPATDRLTIAASTSATIATVLDALGRTVLSQRLAAGTATLSVRELPAGVYSVRAGTAVRRFVKQ